MASGNAHITYNGQRLIAATYNGTNLTLIPGVEVTVATFVNPNAYISKQVTKENITVNSGTLFD